MTSQIDWWWEALFRPRLDGLTNDEFMWEPAPNCWTLRSVDSGCTTHDFQWPPPTPAPVTTVAWRIQHIGVGCLAKRTRLYFPHLMPEPWDVEPFAVVTPFPIGADDAIGFLDRWWHAWRAGVGSLTDEELWKPLAGVEGDYPEMHLSTTDPFVHMVLHNHRELMHHGAEIALLRDLYLASRPPSPQ